MQKEKDESDIVKRKLSTRHEFDCAICALGCFSRPPPQIFSDQNDYLSLS